MVHSVSSHLSSTVLLAQGSNLAINSFLFWWNWVNGYEVKIYSNVIMNLFSEWNELNSIFVLISIFDLKHGSLKMGSLRGDYVVGDCVCPRHA